MTSRGWFLLVSSLVLLHPRVTYSADPQAHGNLAASARETRRPSAPLTLEEARRRVGDSRGMVRNEGVAAKAFRINSQANLPKQRAHNDAVRHTSIRMDGSAVRVSIQATRPDLQHLISPLIYGVNEWGDVRNPTVMATNQAAGIRMIRRGGNPYSRWNWEFDTSNRGADWFFETIPDSQEGQESTFDVAHKAHKAIGADTLATIPMLGWLPKARAQMCSFSIRKYGAQQKFDPWFTDCGNGVTKDGVGMQRTNNRDDAAALKGPDHQQQWARNLVAKFGTAATGGVKYYCLDNEPVWWSYVHRDIVWNASNYDQIFNLGVTYAAALKSVDPTAQVLGPVSGGWSDIFYSVTDMESGWHSSGNWWSNPVDRNKHGGVPFLQWYLDGFAAYEVAFGQRLLDVVDFHAYVAGDAASDASDPATQAARVAATRTFWDPTYACGNACNFIDPVTAPDGVPKILPRIQAIIDSTSPGLGIAITEYAFGGRFDISGAVAQAEVLGIFGKNNVTIATVFTGLNSDTTLYQAFRMYGNYDDQGSQFGALGVGATSDSTSTVSAYAAINTSTNKLTIMLINLTPQAQQVNLSLDVLPKEPIKVFRYDNNNLNSIVQLAPLPATEQQLLALTGYSLNLLEVSL